MFILAANLLPEPEPLKPTADWTRKTYEHWNLLGGSSHLVSGYTSHLSHLEGEQPYLEDLLTMVINHLLNGMILQVVIFRPEKKNFNW